MKLIPSAVKRETIDVKIIPWFSPGFSMCTFHVVQQAWLNIVWELFCINDLNLTWPHQNQKRIRTLIHADLHRFFFYLNAPKDTSVFGMISAERPPYFGGSSVSFKIFCRKWSGFYFSGTNKGLKPKINGRTLLLGLVQQTKNWLFAK